MRGVQTQATRRCFHLGTLFFSAHSLLHVRRYARAIAADDAQGTPLTPDQPTGRANPTEPRPPATTSASAASASVSIACAAVLPIPAAAAAR